MKLLLAFVLIISTSSQAHDFQFALGHIRPSTTSDIQTKAVEDLIGRLLGSEAGKFSVEVNTSFTATTGNEVFHVLKVDGKIKIIATTGVAAATGFHYYLKYYCSCHTSWQTRQLNLPEELPDINVTIPLNDRFRYYQNVCTPSYSFVWWNWQQWEKHIDWMALNSYNLVLAFNGQEAVWQRVYRNLNLTQEEIDEHFAGPAFLSWSRMGNLRGWGGPLPPSWHSRSLALQKRILRRMRDLGMVPVLPAFAGHVPRAFKRLFPEANLTETERWNDFDDSYCCPYLLDPTDALFRKVGSLFLSEMTGEFGTDHVYNCDTFNELLPPSGELKYLADIGKSVFAAMTDADEEAVWLLQGWLFYHESLFWTEERVESFLRSVPVGRMIVLDLHSEQFPQYDRLHQYFGQPYIWCMLHNFGGTLGMFGSLTILNERPFTARKAINSTMIGTGLTPEGINQNYVVYDLMSEMAWRSEPINLTAWVDHYINRRYGKFDINVSEAWQILKNTIYDFQGLENIRGKYAISRTPSLNINTWKWYDSSDLFSAWDSYIASAASFRNSTGYLHDLVDITRQSLQVLGDEYYRELRNAYKAKDLSAFRDASTVFLEILDDLEAILQTSDAFLLGTWLRDAKNIATNEKEAQLYEFNARNQITLWGPNGEITDYANKQWAGIVSKYFLPRWETFISYCNQTLTEGSPFNKTLIQSRIFNEVEAPFGFDRSEFPSEAQGDTVETAQKIHGRWYQRIHSRTVRSPEDYYQPSEENDRVLREFLPTVTLVG